jgi:hypothetical protein
LQLSDFLSAAHTVGISPFSGDSPSSPDNPIAANQNHSIFNKTRNTLSMIPSREKGSKTKADSTNHCIFKKEIIYKMNRGKNLNTAMTVHR